MSIKKPQADKQTQAKRHLDLYGFWLWHYLMPMAGDKNDATSAINAVIAPQMPCRCRDKKNKCASCEDLLQVIRRKQVFSIFVPWIDYVETPPGRHKLKYSCDEILHNALDFEFKRADLRLEKRFVLNRLGFSVNNLSIESRKAKHGIKKDFFFHLHSNNLLPPHLVLSDINRIYKYFEYIQERNKKHTKDELHSFMVNLNEDYIDYIGVSRFIKEEHPKHFKDDDFLSRAIGYWLFNKMKAIGGEPSIHKLIDELEKLLLKRDDAAHIARKFSDSESTYFSRLMNATQKSVFEKRIFNLRWSK